MNVAGHLVANVVMNVVHGFLPIKKFQKKFEINGVGDRRKIVEFFMNANGRR